MREKTENNEGNLCRQGQDQKGKKGGKMSKASLCEKLRECNHNRTKDGWIWDKQSPGQNIAKIIYLW